MDITAKSISSLPTSALVASIATGLLFISIPLLTKISTIHKPKDKFDSVTITQYKPPPPPEPEQEEKLEEIKKQDTLKKAEPRQTMPQPRLDMAASNLNAGTFGTIPINNLLRQDIKVTDSYYASAYDPSEVDQQPRPIRTFGPKYPFEAQQKGIEGKILVRVVVDSAGQPREPEIYRVEPKEVEGVFEEAALACIMKFKFNPAKKGGKPVDCIVRVPFTFSVTD